MIDPDDQPETPDPRIARIFFFDTWSSNHRARAKRVIAAYAATEYVISEWPVDGDEDELQRTLGKLRAAFGV